MERLRFVPGAIVSPNPITIPVSAKGIDTILVGGAEITRLPAAYTVAHADSGVAVAHADGVVVAHAGFNVDAHVFTQPQAHTMTLVVPAGGGAAVTLNNGAAMEVVGGPFVDGSATINAHALGAVDAHVVTQPNDHLPAAVIAGLADHPGADIAAALINHLTSGATIAVAAVATRLTARTVSLDVNTLVGDLLTLAYLEVGERILVS